MKEKWLDEKFKRTKNWRAVRYIVHDNEVELCTESATVYPIISLEEILKLAEILKEG